jgi:hypothetical protein
MCIYKIHTRIPIDVVYLSLIQKRVILLFSLCKLKQNCKLLVFICHGWYMFHMMAAMAYCIHCHIFHTLFALTNLQFLLQLG